MIKATGRAGDGTPLMILGLSGENLARLAGGEPIGFNLADVGMDPCHVVIMYGRTEQDILTELRGHAKCLDRGGS